MDHSLIEDDGNSAPDAISQIATLGSVTFVTARIAWDVVNAQWAHLGFCALLFGAVGWIYIQIVGAPSDADGQSRDEDSN
jgi:hypothetical protein